MSPFATLAGGAAVVVALGGGCVELGPVGVWTLIDALPVAVIRGLSLLVLDPEAIDVAVEKVVPPATLALDAPLEMALETEESAEDAWLLAMEAPLEIEETSEEASEEAEPVKEETTLDAEEAPLESDDAMEDRALEAEEVAEEIRLVGAGTTVKERVPLMLSVVEVEMLSEAAELPLDAWLEVATGTGEREKPVLEPTVIGRGTQLGT